MDTLALTAVITSTALGAGGLAAAIWSTRENSRLTREGRVHERSIDAYLEILRLVEHRSLWYETRVLGAALTGDEYATMPQFPRDPDVGEQATIAALLAAFGNDRLVLSCAGWTEAAKELDRLFEVATWNWEQDYAGPETPTGPADLAKLRAQFVVLAAERTKIEKAIADEIARVAAGRQRRL